MADELKAESLDLSSLRIHRDEGPRRGRPGSVFLIAGLAALVAVVVAFFLLRGGTRAAVVQTDLVRLVGAGSTSAVLSAGGYILPDRKADVSSKIYGRLEWIGVDAGSKVKAGDVVARLANAGEAGRVDEAKAALAEGERELDRMKRLVEAGVETREHLDRAGTTLDLAKARVKTAEAEYEYTLIRSPFDGIVVRRNAQAGETVGPVAGGSTGSSGTSVCTVVDRSSLEMVADVNETNIAKVKSGQGVEVTVDALPDRKYRGEVRQVVPTADRQKGIVQVKIRLFDLGDDVFPEMAARAAFLREGGAEPGTRRVIAPKGAVRDRNGRRVVFIVDSGKARAAAVETGREGEDGVEILRGLSGGELAIIGGDGIEDGQAVKVADKK